MARYAEATEVSADRSRAEIERILMRYGADAFGYEWAEEKALIKFRMRGKIVRFGLVMPDRNADEFKYTPARGRERDAETALKAWEQACRQRWRALALVVKAKLEAIEAQISTFEEEFLAFLVLPDNTTVGDRLVPQIEEAYRTSEMPPMLSDGRVMRAVGSENPGG